MALITAATEEGSSGLRWGGGGGAGAEGKNVKWPFGHSPPPPPPPGLYKHLTATEGSLCAFSLV